MTAVICSILAGMACYYAVLHFDDRKKVITWRVLNNAQEKKRLFNSDAAVKIVKFAARLNGRLPLGAYRESLGKKLALSGGGATCTADEFVARKEIMFVFPLIILIATGVPITGAIVLSSILFLVPDMELSNARRKYEKAVLRALPPALDIIASCVEAGLTFDAALSKYTEKSGKNFLSAEFRSYLQEIRLGKSRREALAAMADRAGMPEIDSFSSAVARSIEYGTGMSAALRSQCASIRSTCARRAEKLAAEAPVKLLFPLIFFIFPVVFLIIFGPLILRFLSYK